MNNLPIDLKNSAASSESINMHQAIPYRSWTSITPADAATVGTAAAATATTVSVGIAASAGTTVTSASAAVSASKADDSSIGLMPESYDARSEDFEKVMLENAIVIVGKRDCCMCHVMKKLLLVHGVNPTLFQVEEGDQEVALIRELSRITGEKDVRPQFPVVFFRGKMFGGLERVMDAHISGELVPMLKDAGALWL